MTASVTNAANLITTTSEVKTFVGQVDAQHIMVTEGDFVYVVNVTTDEKVRFATFFNSNWEGRFPAGTELNCYHVVDGMDNPMWTKVFSSYVSSVANINAPTPVMWLRHINPVTFVLGKKVSA
jgi:hypothetical protein